MPTLSDASSGLQYVALPAGILLALASIPRAMAATKRTRAFVAFMTRPVGDVRPGPGDFQVTTVSDQPSTNLGTSTSTPTSKTGEPTGTPVLDTQPVILQIINGPRIRLRAGTKLFISRFAGARRNRLDATTTEQGGMKVTHSFEVNANTQFSLQCILPDYTKDATYRQSGVIDVLPIGDRYLVRGGSEPESPVSTAWNLIICAIAGVVIGVFLSFFGTLFFRGGCGGKTSLNAEAGIDIGSITALVVGLAMLVGGGGQSTTMTELIKSGHYRP